MGLVEGLKGVDSNIRGAISGKIDVIKVRLFESLFEVVPPYTYPSSPEDARMGYIFFARASMRYPASVSAQASSIAINCQDAEKKPEVLRDALLRDSRRIRDLTDTANRLHASGGHRVRIDWVRTHQVVSVDFTLAGHLIQLPRTNLEDIGRLYDEHRQEPSYPREEMLQNTIEIMLGYRPQVISTE